MLVVAPSEESTFLHSSTANLFNFAFKLGAPVLINDAESVSHEVVVHIAKLQSCDATILNDLLALLKANLAQPQLHLLWLPFFYAWPDLFLQG